MAAKITPSLPTYYPQLHWGVKIICALVSSILLIAIFKQALSYLNTPAPSKPLPPVAPQHPKPPLLPPHYLKSLGMSARELEKRGIQSTKDLDCLGLFCFDERIEGIKRKIARLGMSPRVEHVLVQRGTLVHRIEVSNLDKDYEVIKEIYQNLMVFMSLFIAYHQAIENLCSSPIPNELDLFQDMENTRQSLLELSAQCDLLFPDKEGHAKGLSTLGRIAMQLTELDKKRQIYWLKVYLVQDNLLQFWKREEPNEQARSLHNYFVKTNRSGWDGYRINS